MVAEVLSQEINEQRDRLLLKAAFTAWNPQLRLSTTNLMKTSIARILMMKQLAAAAEGSEPEKKVVASAKLRGVAAPQLFEPLVGDTVDAMDVHFKWYPSEVCRKSEVRGVLLKFADLPSRFNAWVPVNAGRLAPLGTFTEGYSTDAHTRGSYMVNGTTAEIPVDSKVELY